MYETINPERTSMPKWLDRYPSPEESAEDKARATDEACITYELANEYQYLNKRPQLFSCFIRTRK